VQDALLTGDLENCAYLWTGNCRLERKSAINASKGADVVEFYVVVGWRVCELDSSTARCREDNAAILFD
jgi:hypothetical protein